MIRKSKKFAWPKKLWDKPRILAENKLVEEYGLKNKKEIWKTDAKIKYFRNRAKVLITSDSTEQEVFFNKLNIIGLKVSTIAEVLALNIEDLLKRRLATVVWKKGLANTAKHARQLIVHKKIKVGNTVVNIPSYIVKLAEENDLSLKEKIKKPKVVEKVVEETTEETETVVEEKENKEEIVQNA